MKPDDKDIKQLQEQIKHDQEQPLKPAEKRLKVDESFESVVKKMAGAKPKPKKSQ